MECHHRGQVMRQYRRDKPIPADCDTHPSLYQDQLIGNDNTNWRTKYDIHIDKW